MEKIEPVILKKKEFEYGDESYENELSTISAYHVSVARNENKKLINEHIL